MQNGIWLFAANNAKIEVFFSVILNVLSPLRRVILLAGNN